MADTYNKASAGCPECDGTGADDMDGTRPLKCLACNGTGHENPASASLGGGEASEPENSATLRSFTTGEAAQAFGPGFLEEARCRAWVLRRLHPEGGRCPACGLALDDDAGFYAGKRAHCGRCGLWFTARTGTFLQGSQLSYSSIFLLATLAHCKVTTNTIAALIGVSADTVRLWIKRFRAFEGE